MEMLIPIVAIISIVVVIIFIRKFIHSERMLMIQNGGVEANIFKMKPNVYLNLRYGLLFIGAGLGLLIGGLLDNARIMEEEAAYFSMILIFGGLGLCVSYILEKRAERKKK